MLARNISCPSPSAVGFFTAIPLAALVLVNCSKPDPKVSHDVSKVNVQRLSIAVLMYKESYDQVFPLAERWETLVTPFVDDPSLFKTFPADRPTSYAFNTGISWAVSTTIPNPSKVPMIFESGMGGHDSFGSVEHVFARDGSVLMAMADGGAKFFPKDSFSILTWNPEAIRLPPVRKAN